MKRLELESIFREGLEDWINQNLVSRAHPILEEIESKAKVESIPILSPTSGAILKFLIEVFQPKRILELGTGLGYSTCWMLLSKLELQIDTIDRNPDCLKEAKEFISKIIQPNQNVNYLKTHGLLYLRNQTSFETYDFIFIDFDKITYPELLEIFLEHGKKDAKILFDNVLWHGQLNPEIHTRPSDLAIQKLWRLVREKNLNTTLFPAGDGLLLIQK